METENTLFEDNVAGFIPETFMEEVTPVGELSGILITVLFVKTVCVVVVPLVVAVAFNCVLPPVQTELFTAPEEVFKVFTFTATGWEVPVQEALETVTR